MWVIFLESFKVSDTVPRSCAGTLKRLECSLLKDRRRHGCAQKRLRSDRHALIVWRRGKVTDEANPHAARPLSLERSRRAPLSSKFLQSGFFLQTDRVPLGVRGGRERERWRRGRSEPRLLSRRRSPGPRGPSSHQRSATSRPRSQPLFKNTFPSGRPRLLPAPARGPGPRSTPLRPLVWRKRQAWRIQNRAEAKSTLILRRPQVTPDSSPCAAFKRKNPSETPHTHTQQKPQVFPSVATRNDVSPPRVPPLRGGLEFWDRPRGLATGPRLGAAA